MRASWPWRQLFGGPLRRQWLKKVPEEMIATKNTTRESGGFVEVLAKRFDCSPPLPTDNYSEDDDGDSSA